MQYTTRLVRRMLALALVSATGNAQSITSVELGRNGLFRSPAVMSGLQTFDAVRVTFSSDVYVDMYDLTLSSVEATNSGVNADGFTYDPFNFVATWPSTSGVANVNARYRIVLSGVWTTNEVPLPDYTNDFHILTGDVSPNNLVSAQDELIIINHINTSQPYNPQYDINLDGVVNPTDALIINNLLNLAGENIGLVPSGAFMEWSKTPTPKMSLQSISLSNGIARVSFNGLPWRSRLSIEASEHLDSPSGWAWIGSTLVTNELDSIPIILLPNLDREFYRGRFE